MEFAIKHIALAKVGYDAYSRHTGGKSAITGDPLPEFKDLRMAVIEAWCAAAICLDLEMTASGAKPEHSGSLTPWT